MITSPVQSSCVNNPMHVFLVDDSLLIRQRLTKILAAVGDIDVVGEAEEPHDAINGILRLEPDVVILDLQLVGGTGFEVLERLKKAETAPIIIVLTNFPYPEYKKKCLEGGADYFFDKGSAFDEMPHVFSELLRQSHTDGSQAATYN